MQGESASPPDWRNWAAYTPLLDADRSLFAWEWLRRDRDYRAAARGNTKSDAAAYGLVDFENPQLGVPVARPLWASNVHPYVLAVEVGWSALAGDRFDAASLGGVTRTLTSESGEHLLVSDGLRSIRLDGPHGAFTKGPVSLHFVLDGLISAEQRLIVLRRFLAFCKTGEFSRSLHRRECRARRWALMLRTHDAIAAGAHQREIAATLLRRSASEPRWRSQEPSLRSQVQRLVRSARYLAGGGYRGLLR